ncbi:MAG: amidohydrolase family protein [Pseudohongiellaceae bacterium]|nr:amidohydrolase family protein [Pseudohongiellaceae bacterium]
MSALKPGSNEWLAQVQEDIIEPDRAIIDPHHHLWLDRLGHDYMLDDLWSDTDAGHKVEKTIFIECRAFYRPDGPEHLRSLGETETIAKLAKKTQETTGKASIEGIVAHADLRKGDSPELLDEILAAHKEAADGLLKGIRHSGARDPRPENLLITGRAPAYLYGREDFRAGVRQLAKHSLTYDTWHFHHQNEDFVEMVQTAPDTTIILDHFGTPLGVGIYAGCQDDIFTRWKEDMAELAKCENVYMKLGGLAMPDNGFGWDKNSVPPTSDEFVAKQQKYYLYILEKFGVERCMFESNFPVDRLSISYHVLWNGLKKMVSDFSESEKHALFYGTAEKVYKL